VITEHSIVVLNEDRAAEGLTVGDVGAVVHIYEAGKGYEVEFVDGGGTTVALLTLPADKVRPLNPGELLHARKRASP
jgi:hypothetical protein